MSRTTAGSPDDRMEAFLTLAQIRYALPLAALMAVSTFATAASAQSEMQCEIDLQEVDAAMVEATDLTTEQSVQIQEIRDEAQSLCLSGDDAGAQAMLEPVKSFFGLI